MGYFKRSGKPSGDRNFNTRSFGGRDSDSRSMFQTKCDRCHQNCEVPFKPNGSKPVLCNNCFKSHRGEDFGQREERSFRKPSYDRPQSYSRPPVQPNYNEKFEALNAKVDKLMKMVSALSPRKEKEAFTPLPTEVKAVVKPKKKKNPPKV
jgi:CxxC-x17-CxxC domain-containing protein